MLVSSEGIQLSNIVKRQAPLLIAQWGLFERFELCWDDIVVHASSYELSYPFLRIVQNGYLIHPVHYMQYTEVFSGDPLSGQQKTNWENVEKARSDGCVVVMDSMEKYVSAVQKISERVLKEAGWTSQTNGYFATSKGKGFAEHADRESIIVLQLTGEKVWKLRAEDAAEDVVMRQGDALFLPAGVRHSVEPRGDSSIHLSITLLKESG